MKRHALRHGLLLAALGVALLAGCNVVTGRRSSGCCGRTPAVQVCSECRPSPAPSYSNCCEGAPAPAPVAVPPPAAPFPRTPCQTPRLPDPSQLQPPRPLPPRVGLNGPAPDDAGDAPRRPVARLGFEELPDSAPPPVVQTAARTELVPVDVPVTRPRGEPEMARKSFVDLTASPCFSHAPDYNWIIGQVEYSRIAREWRLRYASVDEMDQHGGRVVLIENHHVTLLRDGQYVHVRGHLVNSPTTEGPVHYRIESFRALEHADAATPPAPPEEK